MVGAIDNDSVVDQAGLLKCIQDETYLFVNKGTQRQIAGNG